MISAGHSGLSTTPCGLIINSTKGWLGASPYARVTDPSCVNINGIVEFNDKSQQEACNDAMFYCQLVAS